MEIYTGIDIVENERIRKAVDRFGDRFLSRIFTDREIKYCLGKKDYIPCLAARFAAKEAFIKAFYQGFTINIPPKLIEIRGNQGKPAEIFLHFNNNQIESILKRTKYTLSISHEKKYSVAVVILYSS
ncbi:holo-[acyl-carrier-protein] synthase [Persephonella atlantica]|uniref:Holo-[acyl-carrier-protein] synthase n=1 Tax=Persephonella atlantica TaxID=2699429 RepID=A0ABS1GH05_9AQUI|nr:holo-[acyl-carrier-protein] synthase [Persephonella atlantica]